MARAQGDDRRVPGCFATPRMEIRRCQPGRGQSFLGVQSRCELFFGFFSVGFFFRLFFVVGAPRQSPPLARFRAMPPSTRKARAGGPAANRAGAVGGNQARGNVQ